MAGLPQEVKAENEKSFSDGSASQSLILRLAAFAESGYLEGAK
jgi:hypothetical protein